MKICVNAISPEGMDLEENVNPAELNIETEHVHYPGEINVKAHVEKEKDIIRVNCHISGAKKQLCSRCLSEFESPIDKKTNFIYKIGREHTIELNDNIKDTMILDYPIRILCKPDCKGLCFYCGKDLNEGPCNCKRS